MITIIIFLILFIFILIVFARYYSRPKIMGQDKVDALYRTMYYTDKILTENDIPYFITCGTLLGSVRGDGLIPWDNDIDIGVMQEDIEKIYSLDPIFKSVGLRTDFIDHVPRVMADVPDVFIDFFPYIKVNDKYVHADPLNRKRFSKEYFYEDDLFPLKRNRKYGPLLLLGPNQAEKVLERMYGKNWETPIDYSKSGNFLDKILNYGKIPENNFTSFPTDNFLKVYET